MSVNRLLRSFDQNATISNRSAGTVDDFGNAADVFTAGATWPCRLWQTSGTEANSDRDTQAGDYQLVLPAAAVIDGRSRVVVDGSTFEVVGPPLLRRTPSGPSHITATLVAST